MCTQCYKIYYFMRFDRLQKNIFVVAQTKIERSKNICSFQSFSLLRTSGVSFLELIATDESTETAGSTSQA